jgi:iron(III) transport system substrate-binding protein
MPSTYRAIACAWTLLLTCSPFGGHVAAENLTSGAASNDKINTANADLVIGTTTDISEISELVAGFRVVNPGISVQYSKVVSTKLFDSIVRPDSKIDFVWSSSMDSQIKLANDGYATEYRSPEANGIPAWAQWKDLAYGVTAEPVVIVYNKRLLREDLVPRDHAELLRILTEHPSFFRGKIATYDPELSGTGLLFITQDVRITPQTWKLVAAMGAAGVKLYTHSGPMIDEVTNGDLLLAYNIPGSYALERAKRDHDLGIIFPSDYTLLMSRIALIPRAAPHLEAARRFMDYLLSRAGQARLAQYSLGSVRNDLQPAIPGSGATKSLQPIALNLDLLTYLDQAKRAQFLKKWKKTLQDQ